VLDERTESLGSGTKLDTGHEELGEPLGKRAVGDRHDLGMKLGRLRCEELEGSSRSEGGDREAVGRRPQHVKALGADSTIMATDFGQAENDEPVKGFVTYMKSMMALGIPADQIVTMVQKNPAQVLGI